jgi:hypothetical protein
MSYNTITRFLNTDILIDWGKSKEGYPSDKTEGEMIDLALKNGYPIIVKNGKKGKWYLKGNGRSIEYLKLQIEEKKGKSRDGVFCLLIE